MDAQAKEFEQKIESSDKKVSQVNKEAERKIKLAKKKAAEATEKAEKIAKEAEAKKTEIEMDNIGGSTKSSLTEVHKAAQESEDDDEEQAIQFHSLTNLNRYRMAQFDGDDHSYESALDFTDWD